MDCPLDHILDAFVQTLARYPLNVGHQLQVSSLNPAFHPSSVLLQQLHVLSS